MRLLRLPRPSTKTDAMDDLMAEINCYAQTYLPMSSSEKGVTKHHELHQQLLAIHTKILRLEEHDHIDTLNDVCTRFERTAAKFLDYLRKFHKKSLFSKCVSPHSATKMDNIRLAINDDVGCLNSSLDTYLHNLPMSNQDEPPTSVTPFHTDDEIINKARIPRDKLVLGDFIARGAFGQVYKGVYNGKVVAVKAMEDVGTFMKEIKIAAGMGAHKNIVQFIGVAWNSLEDFCCVMEFVDGGDLRTLLNEYNEQSHLTGFDVDKLKIAYHVMRGLVHLHSRKHPVLHRDLKSRNVLLNQALDAKLTDFGVSRKRVNGLMTANVGTSLWMAPEVMVGQRYDEKADVFSFGVVLSELSLHELPYSHAKRAGSNQPLAPFVVMHRVATGMLRVDFSESGPQSLVHLGRACVSMDPGERPTAAEALHTVCSALARQSKAQL